MLFDQQPTLHILPYPGLACPAPTCNELPHTSKKNINGGCGPKTAQCIALICVDIYIYIYIYIYTHTVKPFTYSYIYTLSRSKQCDITAANMARAVDASQRHQNHVVYFDSACLNCSKTRINIFNLTSLYRK